MNECTRHWPDAPGNSCCLAGARPGIAERILINAKQMLKWAVRRKLIETSALAGINAKEDLQIKKLPGSRTLAGDEIARVWRAIERSRMATKNRLFLKLCLIYGCRNGELRQAEKSHFDFERGVWTVPPGNHKLGHATGKPLLRPITKEIAPLIKRRSLAGRPAHPLGISDRSGQAVCWLRRELRLDHHRG